MAGENDIRVTSASSSNQYSLLTSLSTSPTTCSIDDFHATCNYKELMYIMSSCTPDDIFSPTSRIIKRLFNDLVKQACKYAGFWYKCPYIKDISSREMEVFLSCVLSIVPQLDSHKDVIWSKLDYRFRKQRFRLFFISKKHFANKMRTK